MHHTNQPLARPEEIRAFIDKEYPELTGGQISIGLLGNHYRVSLNTIRAYSESQDENWLKPNRQNGPTKTLSSLLSIEGHFGKPGQ